MKPEGIDHFEDLTQPSVLVFIYIYTTHLSHEWIHIQDTDLWPQTCDQKLAKHTKVYNCHKILITVEGSTVIINWQSIQFWELQMMDFTERSLRQNSVCLFLDPEFRTRNMSKLSSIIPGNNPSKRIASMALGSWEYAMAFFHGIILGYSIMIPLWIGIFFNYLIEI